MNPTRRVFDQDPFCARCQANVLQVHPSCQGVEVVLDQTLFYPEAGGQLPDHGNVDGQPLLGLREEQGVIFHTLAQAPQTNWVELELDFDRRFELMQQHSGEHILSGVLLSLYKAHNRGFHMGEQISTIDIDLSSLTSFQIREVEARANRLVWENHPVRVQCTDAEHLENFPIRKAVKAKTGIRVVTIEGADCCACCGTHVQRSGQIGQIKIVRAQAYKGMTRLSFICGVRTLQDHQQRVAITQQAGEQLSCPLSEIPARIQKTQELISDLRKEAVELKNQLLEQRLQALPGGNFCFLKVENSSQLKKAQEILSGRYQSGICVEQEKGQFIAYNYNAQKALSDWFERAQATWRSLKGKASVQKAQGSMALLTNEEREEFEQAAQKFFA